VSVGSIAALLVVLGFAACTHARAPESADSLPTKINRCSSEDHPAAECAAVSDQVGPAFSRHLEVPIDENGHAESFGIRLMPPMDDLMKQSNRGSGSGSDVNPAKRDGVPVVGVFKMTFR
jgi:hypothetical protein